MNPFIIMNELYVDDKYQIIKKGKITKHVTKAKGKTYTRGKIYLPNNKFIGKKYNLIELDKILPDLENKGVIRKRSGYLIVFNEWIKSA